MAYRNDARFIRFPMRPMGAYDSKGSSGGAGTGQVEGWEVANTATSGLFSFLEAWVTGEREAPPVTENYYEGDQTEPAPATDDTIGGLGIPTWALVAAIGAVGVGIFLMVK